MPGASSVKIVRKTVHVAVDAAARLTKLGFSTEGARNIVKEKHEQLKHKERAMAAKLREFKRSATVNFLGKAKAADGAKAEDARPWEYAMLLGGGVSGVAENDGHMSARARTHWYNLRDTLKAAGVMGHRMSHARVTPAGCDGAAVEWGTWREEVRNGLIKAGLIIAVHDVVKHGVAVQLVLINAPTSRLHLQANRLKLENWLKTGSVGDIEMMLETDDTTTTMDDANHVFTAAERLLLIHGIVSGTTLVERDADGRPLGGQVSILLSPIVESFFPLHDRDANHALLHKFGLHAPEAAVAGGEEGSLMGLRTRLHLMFQRLWLADGDFDEIRNHFGDEVGFYYAWLSHYTTWLGALAPVGITVSFVTGVVSSDNATKVRNIWGVFIILWATLYLCYWARRNNELTIRWQLTGLENLETPRHEFRPEKEVDPITHEETFPHGPRHYAVWKRVTKTSVLVPIMLLVVCVLAVFVVFIFWFELWIIFDWGKCTERNEKVALDYCVDQSGKATSKMCPAVPSALKCSDSVQGNPISPFAGWAMELCPGLMEALFFELMLAIFRAIVDRVCRWQNWRIQQHYDKAFAIQIFTMEFIGMFCWYFILAFYFVPDLDPVGMVYVNGTSCLDRASLVVDKALFGEQSFSCMKDKIDYNLRLDMMKAYMLMPFVVNQILNVFLKTLLPARVHDNLSKQSDEMDRSDRMCAGLCSLLGCILGHEPRRPPGEIATRKATVMHSIESTSLHDDSDLSYLKDREKATYNVEAILDESGMWHFNVFEEYVEMVLQFCWVCLFSVIFPWGALAAFCNNMVELRSDTYKLSHVCRRPVPKQVTSIGPWSGILSFVVWIGVVVSIGIMVISLGSFAAWDARYKTAAGSPKVVFDYWKEALLFVLLAERLLLAILHLIKAAIPDVPADVTEGLNRREDQMKQFMEERQQLSLGAKGARAPGADLTALLSEGGRRRRSFSPAHFTEVADSGTQMTPQKRRAEASAQSAVNAADDSDEGMGLANFTAVELQDAQTGTPTGTRGAGSGRSDSDRAAEEC